MNSDILESLLVSTHRLTRLAAQATGTSTPSAVWRTLSILETDGPMRVGELASASRVTQPGMTRILGTMVEEELVSRIADVDDSRAWLISVTAKGRSALADWRHQLAEAMQPWFGGLTVDEWQTLARASHVLETRIQAGAAAAVAS